MINSVFNVIKLGNDAPAVNVIKLRERVCPRGAFCG